MFVSYAQNFEDVILWRALKGISGGCYVDIGAQDPLVDSVSRSFYENGWRGVHADANPEYAQRLRDARPDEQVVEAIIGVGGTSAKFFVVPGTGLSTGDPRLAEKYRNAGYTVQDHIAPVLPLSNLLSSIQSTEVHWMKIDVEGMEAAVLSSWGECEVRPWILCIESTDPNSQTPNHEKWEQEVLSRGYEFVYFDGLSRFYVADKQQELKSYFGPGPNIFDEFRLVANSGLVQATGDTATTPTEDGISQVLTTTNAVMKNTESIKNQIMPPTTEASLNGSLPAAEVKLLAQLVDKMRRELQQWAEEKGRLLSDLANERKSVAELNKKLHEIWLENVSLRNSRDSLLSSTSWRITAPLRAVVTIGRMPAPQSKFATLLRRSLAFVRSKPALHRAAVRLVGLVPVLDKALRKRLATIQGPSSLRRSARHLAGDQDMTQIDAPLLSPWEQKFMTRFEAIAAQRKLQK